MVTHFFLTSSSEMCNFIDQMMNFNCRYLATGESSTSLSFQYNAHRTTVSKIVRNCLRSIIKHFLHKAIPKPTTETFKGNIRDFFTKWNYPNCCGAIDGKHIKVRNIANSGSAFFNYKEYYSIVLLAIVDANYKFVAVDVGSFGREGDAGKKFNVLRNIVDTNSMIFIGIFLKSEMGKLINNGQFNIPPASPLPYTDIVLPNVILGDEAFALKTNMMKPYPRQQSLQDRTKTIYNYRHSRARRTTENAFGIMASYFRIFFTPIHANVETIDDIVLAACILHNMMRSEKICSPSEATFGNMTSVILPTNNLVPMAGTIGRPSSHASDIRDAFKNYFNGGGAIDWQEDMV